MDPIKQLQMNESSCHPKNTLEGSVLAGICASDSTSARQTLFLRRVLISSKFDKINLIVGMIVK